MISESELKKKVQCIQHKHRFDLTGQDEESEYINMGCESDEEYLRRMEE